MKVGKTFQTFLSFFIAFAMIFPSAVKVSAIDSYPVDQNAIVLDADFTGDSTNDHTYAKAIWTYGDFVYLMVDSTHDLKEIRLKSTSGTITSDNPIKHGYTVVVGGTTFNADESQGNIKDSHLTVFKFSLSDILTTLKLNEGGIYTIDVISEQGKGHWIIGGTLTIRIPKAEVKVSKTWQDGPKDDVSIQLYRKLKNAADSTFAAFGDPFTLTSANPAKTISDLNFTDNIGRIYTYTAKEVNIGEGYNSAVVVTGPTLVNGVQVFTIAIKNTYTPPLTDIKVTKVWKDGDDPSGRPPSLTYYLFADDGSEPVRTETVDNPNWNYTFKGLPKTRLDGSAIKYSVKEAPVAGYVTSILGLIVTNVRSAKTDVDVEKLWKDGNDPSGRPATVTFNLFADGKKVDSIVLTSAMSWKHTFKNLEKYDMDGKLIKYTVTEEAVTGYTPTIVGLTITNLRVGKTDIPVEKFWNDDGPAVRPQSIRINLLANGIEVDEKDITAAMNWKYTFSQVDKYDIHGQLIIYTIKEDPVSGYKSVVDGLKVTNTKVGTTNIDVAKIWMDDNDTAGRPKSITIYLKADGTQVDSAQLNAEGSWKYTFKDKPAYGTDGKAITYTIAEGEVPGYVSTVNGFEVTNVRTGEIDIPVEKIWLDNGVRTIDKITVNLYKQVTSQPPMEMDAAMVTPSAVAWELVDTLELNAGNDWKDTFMDLPEFDEKGYLIDYLLDEIPVEGYSTSIKENEDGSFTITNLRTGITSVSGSKTWMDEEGTSLRPETITIILLRNGAEDKRAEIDEEDLWTFEFKNLPAFDNMGIAYVYSVDEVAVPGYETSTVGYDIFNLRKGEIDIPVEKIWLDNGERAIEEITVNLYKKVVPQLMSAMDLHIVTPIEEPKEFVKALVLNAENQWKGTFEDLDEFDAKGYPIEYIVEEEAVEGYTSSKLMNEDGSFTFTNLRTGIVDIEGEKTWFDDDEDSRPEFITVVLMRNGEELDRMDVTEVEGLWTYSFKDLDEFDDEGIAYLYEIEELPVEDYNTFILGFDIQNVRTGLVNVNGEKTWNDLMGRPESITINLLQNGVEIDDMVVKENEEGKWTYSFTELPEFDGDGVTYLYSVTEDALAGYEPTVDGYNILNRQLRGTLRIVKTDDFDDSIEDVIFRIEDENGVLIDTGSTDENGILEFTLPLGKYIVRELFAPAKYIMDDEEKVVTIDEDGEILILSVVNTLKLQLPDTGGKPKPVLPKTGAESSFIFYGIGAMLTLAGFTLLKKKKRTSI